MRLGSKFTLLAVAASASAITIPVSRLKARGPPRAVPRGATNLGTAVLAAGGNVGLTNSQNNNLYASTIQVGGRDMVVQVDTGSSDTWLYPTQETKDAYSGAVVHNDLPLNLSYGLGSVAGYISQLTVTFAGYQVQNQAVLLVQNEEQMSLIEAKTTNGLLGLGFDTLSQMANAVAAQNQPWGRTLLSNIFLSDPTTPNHIAFRLDRTGDSNSTDVGAFDISTFAPGLEAINNTAAIPIFSPDNQELKYWSVLVDGVSLNGQDQPLRSTVAGGTQTPPAGKVAAVLDTGYSLPQLSPTLAHAIYTAMNGVLLDDGTNTTYIVPCMSEAQLVFNIGGHSIPIHPLDLTQVQTVQTKSGQNYTVCENAFQPFSSNAGGGIVDYILGDAFLRNVYSLYDYGDYVNGYSGLPQGDPYIKLLPLTDATAASAEFKTARAAQLNAAGMPPQLDPTTANGEPRALPGTGGGSGGGGRGGSNGAGRVVASFVAIGAAIIGVAAGAIL